MRGCAIGERRITAGRVYHNKDNAGVCSRTEGKIRGRKSRGELGDKDKFTVLQEIEM